MAIWTVREDGAGDFLTPAAALADAGVVDGDEIHIDGTWSADDTTALTISKNVTIKAINGSKHPGRPWMIGDTHYRHRSSSGHSLTNTNSGLLVLEDLDIQNKSTGVSDEVMRNNVSNTVITRRCLLGFETRTDQQDIFYSELAPTATFINTVFYNAYRAAIDLFEPDDGCVINIVACAAYNVGFSTNNTSRSGLVGVNSPVNTLTVNIFNTLCHTAVGEVITTNNQPNATFNVERLATNATKVLQSGTSYTLNDLNNVVGATITDSTAASAYIVQSLANYDMQLVDHANNLAVDAHSDATGAGQSMPSDDLVGTTRTAPHDIGASAIEAGPPPRAVVNADGDNDVYAGQTFTIQATGLDSAPTNQVVDFGGLSLTINSWTETAPGYFDISVDMPLHPALEHGVSHTLTVTDDTGAVVFGTPVMLSINPAWETVVLGAIPDADTKSFYHEFAKPAVLDFTAETGDILFAESSAAQVIDEEWSPTIDPAQTVTGDSKVWDVSAGTFTALVTYTWTDGGVPGLVVTPDNTTPSKGDAVSFTIDFGVGPYTVTYGGHSHTIDTQGSSTVNLTWPDLKLLGGGPDLSNLAYETAHDFVVTDTSDSRTATVSMSTDIESGDFHHGHVASLTGIYAMSELSAVEVGDEIFIERLSGIGAIDVAAGTVPENNSVRVWVRDLTDGLWNASVDLTIPAGNQSRTIDSISGTFAPGQQITLNCSNTDFNPLTQQVNVSGVYLTIVDWNGGSPICSIPLHINLRVNRNYTISLTDDTGTISLTNQLLQIPAGWEILVFGGTAPSGTPEGLHPETVNVLGTTPASGDEWLIESVSGMTFDADGEFNNPPANGTSFDFKLWDESAGIYTSVATFTHNTGDPVNNPATGAPVITGTASQGQTLGVNTSGIADTDGLGTFAYQWKRNGGNITGATSATYVLVGADVGTTITVTVSFTDGQGNPESLTSTGVGPVSATNTPHTGTVTIDNMIPSLGDLLTASHTLNDPDGLGAISYQWRRNGSDIAGATGATYIVVADDIGDRLSVVASYTDGGGTFETEASAETNPVTGSTAPLITLYGPATIKHVVNTTYTDAGAKATSTEGDISGSIVVTGTIDTSTLGAQVLAFNVTDGEGEVADTVYRTVVVYDPAIQAAAGNRNSIIKPIMYL